MMAAGSSRPNRKRDADHALPRTPARYNDLPYHSVEVDFRDFEFIASGCDIRKRELAFFIAGCGPHVPGLIAKLKECTGYWLLRTQDHNNALHGSHLEWFRDLNVTDKKNFFADLRAARRRGPLRAHPDR